MRNRAVWVPTILFFIAAFCFPCQADGLVYAKKCAVVATGLNNGVPNITMTYPGIEFYQLCKIKGISDSNLYYSSFTAWDSFARGDQTSQWDLDNDWAGKDMYSYPTKVVFDDTNSSVSAAHILDGIVYAGSDTNSLLLIYMMGHGSGSYTPGDGRIELATAAGATDWQGLPLDGGLLHHNHLNKALSLAAYKLAIIMLDGCNSEAIIKDLDYTDNDINFANGIQPNPLTKNVIAIATTGITETYSGTPFGHYLVHLSRAGYPIKEAVDSAGAHKQLHPIITCFGPNKNELEQYVLDHTLFGVNILDSISPIIAINSVNGLSSFAQPIYHQYGQVRICGTVKDSLNEVAALQYRVDGGAYNVCPFAQDSFILDLDLAGDNVIELKAQDANGNWCTPETLVTTQNLVAVNKSEKHCSPSLLFLSANANAMLGQSAITYSLPYAGNVDIDIIDLCGKKIMSITGTYKSAGSYKDYVDMSAISKGLYFVVMRFGSNLTVRKISNM